MKSKQLVIVILLALGVIAAAFFLTRSPEPLKEQELSSLVAEFFAIIPDDISDEQRDEIKGLLSRFEAKASSDQIRSTDFQEVMQLFEKYVSQGEITRGDLNLVMAKVGYYSFRAYSPDSSDIHPLLEPTETQRDTTQRQHSHD